MLVHLPVGDGDARFGHEFAQPARHALDGIHAIVDEEDLPVSDEFTMDRRRDLLVVVGPDIGEDRMPLFRRRLDRGHLTNPREGHLQCPGDGVADIVSTSTDVRSALMCSLCSTPKRCSSSTMSSQDP